MVEIPAVEPLTVTAGDTVRWRRTLAAYPADAGWVLTYTLLNAAARIVIPAAAVGPAHEVSVAASITGTWSAGDYAWRAQAARAGDVFTVLDGRMAVRPSFGAAPMDTRSSARRALEAVEAYLHDPTNLAAAKYAIAGRSLDRIPLPELWSHRDRLRVEVAREDATAGAGLARGRIQVRFGA